MAKIDIKSKNVHIIACLLYTYLSEMLRKCAVVVVSLYCESVDVVMWLFGGKLAHTGHRTCQGCRPRFKNIPIIIMVIFNRK